MRLQLQELLLNSISKSKYFQEDEENVYQIQEDFDFENPKESHDQNKNCSWNCGEICMCSLTSSPTI